MPLWALLVDVEGFSATYEADIQAMVSLGALLDATHRIGNMAYPESPNRLFAHHVGDSIIIVGEFGADPLDQPVAVGVALLQCVLRVRGAAKAVLAEGDFADVAGCFPDSVREAMGATPDGRLRLGDGIMTVLPVMGTAWISAYRIQGDPTCPSGSLFVVPESIAGKLPKGVAVTHEGSFALIDWVHADFPALTDLLTKTKLFIRERRVEEAAVREYVAKAGVPEAWKANTLRFLGLT